MFSNISFDVIEGFVYLIENSHIFLLLISTLPFACCEVTALISICCLSNNFQVTNLVLISLLGHAGELVKMSLPYM